MYQYRKILNISPWLIEVRKDFLVDLYSGELIFKGSSVLTDDLCIPKHSPLGVQSEQPLTAFNA